MGKTRAAHCDESPADRDGWAGYDGACDGGRAGAGRRDSSAVAPEQALNPLQALIQQRLREREWSYGDVARRGGVPRSTVYTLAITRNLARPPRPATLDGLAKGLDLPVSAVRAAAAESTGLHYYDEVPAEPQRPGDRDRETPHRQHR